MTKTSRPCNGCGKTIYRTHPTGGIKAYCGPECRPECSIDGCEKRTFRNDLCSAHSTRLDRYGDPLTPITRFPNIGPCSVDGCEIPSRKTGMCASHYQMLRKYGEIRSWFYKWGEGGYVPAHTTLRRTRGPAANYRCVDCGHPAQEWSYDGEDPDEITAQHGDYLVAFSRDLDHYDPRCIRCHRIFDNNPIAVKP